jgi:hypothetical protein
VSNGSRTAGDHSLNRRSIPLGGSALAASALGATAPMRLAQAQQPVRQRPPNTLFMLAAPEGTRAAVARLRRRLIAPGGAPGQAGLLRQPARSHDHRPSSLSQ